MTAVEKRDKAYWQALAESQLSPETDVIARNAAITGTYAHWYTTMPDVLKWAGMAAFASHRVGLALMPYHLKLMDRAIVGVPDPHTWEPHIHTVLDDLHLMRETNNLVFHNIGWAHMAYLARDGGLQAIEDCVGDDPDSALLLEGFRLLDQGRQLLTDPHSRRREVEDLIRRGNNRLLKQEQHMIVQRQFDKCDSDLRLCLLVATVMDFNAVYISRNFRFSTWFDLFLWTRGLWLLALTRSLPNITNWRQRWFWVEKAVLPLWKRVEAKDVYLREKMAILMRGVSQ